MLTSFLHQTNNELYTLHMPIEGKRVLLIFATTTSALRENPTERCFLFGDWWLWGSLGLVFIGGTARLFLELARINDKINMVKEILRVACAWSVGAGE